MDPIFGLDNAHREEGMELLTTTHDDVELAILSSILEDEKIPFLTHDRGGGSSVRIITGYSMYGTDILVPSQVLERAKEILQAYREGEPVEDEDGEEPDPEDAEDDE